MTTRYFFFVLLAVGFAGSVWAAPFTGTFIKITSTDDLTTGYYVIAASEDARASYMFVMGSEVKNNRITGVDGSLTRISTTITNPDNSIVYRITKKKNKYTFYNVGRSGWLYFDGTKINIYTDSVSFTCDYNSDSPIGFKFSYFYDDTYKLQYNNGQYGFSVYSGNYSIDMTPVRLFKLEESQDPGSATEVENTEMEMQAKKIVQDGQILILRGERTYTIQGQKTK